MIRASLHTDLSFCYHPLMMNIELDVKSAVRNWHDLLEAEHIDIKEIL
jgi:hypothetical protein